MSQQTEYKKCAYSRCGKLISPGHQARREYCSQACKQAAYRERKARAQSGSVTLSKNRNE